VSESDSKEQISTEETHPDLNATQIAAFELHMQMSASIK
jgi:hypothetical protein